MNAPEKSVAHSSADILLLLGSAILPALWGLAEFGADHDARGWTWRTMVLLALLPVHILCFAWRLASSRGEPERRRTLLGAGALTTLVLVIAIGVASMMLRNAWL